MNILSALSEGLIATIIGMGIVFIALITLSYVLDLFNLFSSKGREKATISDPVEIVKTVVEEEEAEDELELIAVITAAIAASLNTTTDNLQIKSFRRVGTTGSSWNTTARQERLNNSIY